LSSNDKLQLEKEIVILQARLDDLKARLPAHSIPPAMMAELDEIEDQLERAKKQLAELST
jgi:capsule polysaccharide export protein KpsE/RkpR